MSKETTPEARHAELDSASPCQSLYSEETLKQVQGDSTPETPRWIAFTERLPEHGQPIAAYCIDGRLSNTIYVYKAGRHPIPVLETMVWFPLPKLPIE
jgi:hypothetical protein